MCCGLPQYRNASTNPFLHHFRRESIVCLLVTGIVGLCWSKFNMSGFHSTGVISFLALAGVGVKAAPVVALATAGVPGGAVPLSFVSGSSVAVGGGKSSCSLSSFTNSLIEDSSIRSRTIPAMFSAIVATGISSSRDDFSRAIVRRLFINGVTSSVVALLFRLVLSKSGVLRLLGFGVVNSVDPCNAGLQNERTSSSSFVFAGVSFRFLPCFFIPDAGRPILFKAGNSTL